MVVKASGIQTQISCSWEWMKQIEEVQNSLLKYYKQKSSQWKSNLTNLVTMYHNLMWKSKCGWKGRKYQQYNQAGNWIIDFWDSFILVKRYKHLCTNWHYLSPWKVVTQYLIYLVCVSTSQTWWENKETKKPSMQISLAREDGDSKIYLTSKYKKTSTNTLQLETMQLETTGHTFQEARNKL